MTALVRGGHLVQAYANWSRWVAQCGLCPWAKTLQRFEPVMECPLCGTVTEILWPSEDMVKGVERLLLMRPSPANRNWMPGETLHDLMFENGAHGVFDAIPDDHPPGTALFGVTDDRIRHDKLPALVKPRVRRELT